MARNLAKLLLVGVLLASGVLLPGCAGETQAPLEPPRQAVSLDELPEFSGDPFVEVNGNVPSFSEAERDLAALEAYAPLDGLGRCGTAFALIGPETMPTEERGSIGSVKPSGWHLVKYDIVDGAYLYNRCHLIAYRLAGENANERNLVTGTRFMNVRGMVPLEDRVASYVDRTGNHVLYRATPVFEWWRVAFTSKPSRWRTAAQAFRSTCSPTTRNRGWRSITPPARAGWTAR